MKLHSFGLPLVLLAVCTGGAAAEKPPVRIGLLTDTHIRSQKPESLQLVRSAMEIFKEQNVEAVFHIGDLANQYDPEGYTLYRKTVSDVFGTKIPPQYFVFANHDKNGAPDPDAAWKTMRERMDIRHDQYHQTVIKGYPFLLYPQTLEIKRMEQEIQQAVKKFPGKPVFVIDHVPPRDTTCNSRVWGDTARRKLFEHYPQAVVISGHTHNSLYNEQCIWQGNFTAVDTGCLQRWAGSIVGNAPKAKASYELLILDIFPKKLVFHRFSALSKQEICTGRTWTVPLPFDPRTAPYAPAHRKAVSPVPVFAADAAIRLKYQGDPCQEITVTFPEASHPDRTFRYMVELAEKNARGKWQPLARKDEFGNFYLPDGGKKVSVSFDAGFFTSGKEYQVRVTPYNFYENNGETLVQNFTAPALLKGKVRFESKDPMKDCPVLTDLKDGKRLTPENGFIRHPGGNLRMEFPQEIWTGKRNTRFRFTLDMTTDQPEDSNWTLVLRNPEPLANANPRISTPSGKSARMRYVITFRKKAQAYRYYFLLREGKPGRVTFHYVKIEELP